MRFESYHRIIRSTCQAISCTKNLLITVATKLALVLCKVIETLRSDTQIKYSKSSNEKNLSFVEIDGTLYEIRTFLVINMQKVDIEFGKIETIFQVDNKITFSVQIFNQVTFDFHYHAYIVEPTEERREKNDTHYLASRYSL